MLLAPLSPPTVFKKRVKSALAFQGVKKAAAIIMLFSAKHPVNRWDAIIMNLK